MTERRQILLLETYYKYCTRVRTCTRVSKDTTTFHFNVYVHTQYSTGLATVATGVNFLLTRHTLPWQIACSCSRLDSYNIYYWQITTGPWWLIFCFIFTYSSTYNAMYKYSTRVHTSISFIFYIFFSSTNHYSSIIFLHDSNEQRNHWPGLRTNWTRWVTHLQRVMETLVRVSLPPWLQGIHQVLACKIPLLMEKMLQWQIRNSQTQIK